MIVAVAARRLLGRSLSLRPTAAARIGASRPSLRPLPRSRPAATASRFPRYRLPGSGWLSEGKLQTLLWLPYANLLVMVLSEKATNGLSLGRLRLLAVIRDSYGAHMSPPLLQVGSSIGDVPHNYSVSLLITPTAQRASYRTTALPSYHPKQPAESEPIKWSDVCSSTSFHSSPFRN
ncbi:hypothetical protein BHE74_00035315 [Ensete ventricosum]|nr:hypothetical protein BHE74_00035315 [Ensete ventricosum]